VTVYDDIRGHERHIDQLERARKTGRIAHAYLFSGPDGVGKEKVAFAFAQALNCDAGAESPCGNCDSCTRIQRLTHPDVRLVASEEELVNRGLTEPESGRAPSVQIRNVQLDELADLFRHRPYLGNFKVVIVVDADKMNVNSQNRFLKTLEEPSDDSVIILVSAHPEALLSTVRSRCQALSFGPLSRSTVAEYLVNQHQVEPAHASVLAAMAQGSLGRAVQFIDGEVLSLRDELVSGLQQMIRGDLGDVLSLAEEFSEGRQGRQRLQVALDLMEMWFRDVLFVKLNASHELLVNQDRLADLIENQSVDDNRRLLEWIGQIRQTRVSLHGNANPRMAAEGLLLSMRYP
jgi:DNA polymerase-3 subunit delta'